MNSLVQVVFWFVVLACVGVAVYGIFGKFELIGSFHDAASKRGFRLAFTALAIAFLALAATVYLSWQSSIVQAEINSKLSEVLTQTEANRALLTSIEAQTKAGHDADRKEQQAK